MIKLYSDLFVLIQYKLHYDYTYDKENMNISDWSSHAILCNIR